MAEGETRVPFARPWMDEREAEAARRAILSGWVTQGPEVADFEVEFAEAVGARHACALSSGTAALHLALRAIPVRPGDEVVTASLSFVATAAAVRYVGAVPVFVDVEPGAYNMDPVKVDLAVTDKTRAILCVHQMGMPCDLPAIVEIARRRGLPVVEDAACAAGSEVRWEGRWERIGRPHAEAACFSFHPRKILTTGEGGMIMMARDDWDRACRRLRHHGMSVPDTVRHGSREVMVESYLTLGHNYRMTDIQGAVGRVQLGRLSDMIERRRALAGRYGELLSSAGGIELPREPAWARSNWQSYPVRLPGVLDRRAVMQRMLDLGVAARPGVGCAHLEPAFADEPWRAGPGGLRESERARDRTILLPIFHEMTEAEQNRVVSALLDARGIVR